MNVEVKQSKSSFFYKVAPQELNKYSNKPIYFSKPRLVAYYDYKYKKISDAERIKYFIVPKPDQYPLDLNKNYDTYIPNSTSTKKNIELALKYDMSPAADSDGTGNVEKTKVFTRRGTLVNIMEAHYNKFKTESLNVLVSRYNNCIYMAKEDLNDSLNELKIVDCHHTGLLKMLYADSPHGTPKINEAWDENIMLIGVHRSNFGKYDMIYSGEVQGIIDNEIISNFNDLDVLTDRRFVLAKQMWKTLKNSDKKMLNYWLQAYLGNVRDIYFGYKTAAGIIDEPIEHVAVKDLPKNRYWKPSICTGFLYEFLHNVEKLMSSVNCLHTVYVFNYNKDEKRFTYEVFEYKTDKSFITEEYIKFCHERYSN